MGAKTPDDRISPVNPDIAFKRLTERIQDLPTLPGVALELVNLLEDPECSANEIEAILSCDPALTMKVMRVSNSSFFGFTNIKTLREAILLVGFGAVRSIVLAASVFDTFAGIGHVFDRVEFWQHSLGVAVAARLLAQEHHGLDVDEAFLAGLLHDIGKLVFDQYAADQWGDVIKDASRKKIALFEAERTSFGFSHGQVGQWLAMSWKLPQVYVSAIFYHHQPSFAREDQVVVALVHLADILAIKGRLGSGGNAIILQPDEAALKNSGLDLTKLQAVEKLLPDAFAKAKAAFPLPSK